MWLFRNTGGKKCNRLRGLPRTELVADLAPPSDITVGLRCSDLAAALMVFTLDLTMKGNGGELERADQGVLAIAS